MPIVFQVLHEEKENIPATNIDDVTISFDDMDTIPANTNNHRTASSPSSSPPQSHQQQRRSDQNRGAYLNTNGTQSPNSNSPKQAKPTAAPRSSSSASTKQEQPTAAPRQQQQPHKPQQPEGILKPSHDLPPTTTAASNPTDAHFQSMFLESVPNLNRATRGASTNSNSGGQLQFYPPPMMEKAKNGQLNNNIYANSSVLPAPVTATGRASVQPGSVAPVSNGPRTSFRDGQLRRFVAPSGDPAVGAEENEKQRCCIIL